MKTTSPRGSHRGLHPGSGQQHHTKGGPALYAMIAFATLLVTIGTALFIGISSGYVAILLILRAFGRHSTTESAPALATVRVAATHSGD